MDEHILPDDFLSWILLDADRSSQQGKPQANSNLQQKQPQHSLQPDYQQRYQVQQHHQMVQLQYLPPGYQNSIVMPTQQQQQQLGHQQVLMPQMNCQVPVQTQVNA